MKDVFSADIYDSNGDEPQTVFCYITDINGDIADVEIKMPLYLIPSAIRVDVQEFLREYDQNLRLGDLKFSIVPQNEYVAI